MVTERRRLHMAGSTEEFGVIHSVFSTVAASLTMMQVERHRSAALLTLRSPFCLVVHRLGGKATLGFDDIGHTF